jgi:hypothetical protein
MMGDLAVEYGFYAADWGGGDASKGEGGLQMNELESTIRAVIGTSIGIIDVGVDTEDVLKKGVNEILKYVKKDYPHRQS